MADVARQVIEREDYTPRAQPSKDVEIGVVVTAFNRMLDEVQHRTLALKQTQEALREADRPPDARALATRSGTGVPSLAEAGQGFRLGRKDPEQVVEAEDLEDVLHRLVQVREPEVAATQPTTKSATGLGLSGIPAPAPGTLVLPPGWQLRTDGALIDPAGQIWIWNPLLGAYVKQKIITGRRGDHDSESNRIRSISINHFQQIGRITQLLTHFSTNFISYNTGEINIIKRLFSLIFKTGHNHAGHPKENNIETGNQHLGWIKSL